MRREHSSYYRVLNSRDDRRWKAVLYAIFSGTMVGYLLISVRVDLNQALVAMAFTTVVVLIGVISSYALADTIWTQQHELFAQLRQALLPEFKLKLTAESALTEVFESPSSPLALIGAKFVRNLHHKILRPIVAVVAIAVLFSAIAQMPHVILEVRSLARSTIVTLTRLFEP